MFIKQTKKRVGDKTYVNHLLVESVATPNGPRHRMVCSLGSLAPAPAADWLVLAHKVEVALTGQHPLVRDAQVETIVATVQAARRGARPTAGHPDLVAVHADQVTTEAHREAGPVHVGHQLWQRLGLDAVLAHAGLSARTQVLTELMTLNRLVCPRSEHAMPDWVRRTALADLLGEDFATGVSVYTFRDERDLFSLPMRAVNRCRRSRENWGPIGPGWNGASIRRWNWDRWWPWRIFRAVVVLRRSRRRRVPG